MGKKGGWLSCVAGPKPKEKIYNKKTGKSQRLFCRHKNDESDSSEDAETARVIPASPSPKPGADIKNGDGLFFVVEAKNEDDTNAHSSKKDRDDFHVRPPVKSKGSDAALKIQSVFRGYMARRSFRAVKGLMRLKALVRGQSVKRQASTTLNCMQAMARLQHQVLARRIRMSEENQALQRQLLQKHDLEKYKENMGENWDDRTKSKKEVEEQEQRQQLAVIRRERALAYAYTHQQTLKNSPKQATQSPLDPFNPQWGWNWLEKWMAARPWENKTTSEEINSKPPSAKSVATLAQKARHDLKLDQLKSSPSPKNRTHTPGRLSVSRSTQSRRSDRPRRHSSTGSANVDDYRQASLPMALSSISPTSSSKAKSRLSMAKSGTPEKKKLAFAELPSSAQRRHSEPPKTPKVH